MAAPILTLVSKAQAELWLKTTPIENRKIRAMHVARIRDDINSGRWDDSVCNPIRFNRQGHLIDGQHRLTALLESDVGAIRMWVETTESNHIDGCITRSAADIMKMRGEPNSRLRESIIRNVIQIEHLRSIGRPWTTGTRKNALSASMALMVSRCEQSQEALSKCIAVSSAAYCKQPKFGRVFSPTTGGVIAWFCGVDLGDAEYAGPILDQIATGDGVKKGSAVFAYRSFVQGLAATERPLVEIPCMFACFRSTLADKQVMVMRVASFGDVSPLKWS